MRSLHDRGGFLFLEFLSKALVEIAYRIEEEHLFPTIAASFYLPGVYHESGCGRMNGRTGLCKNVHAFMRNGFTPGIGPVRILGIAAYTGALHGHGQVLWNKETGHDDDAGDHQDLAGKGKGCKPFHK